VNNIKSNAVASGLDFPIVGMGASAGGLGALTQFFSSLPASSDMAFVVVLHLSPKHESNIAQLLQNVTKLLVKQVLQPTKIEANHIYVIPPSKDLLMYDGQLVVQDLVRPRGKHVAIDLFFRTLADTHQARAIGIVLSGTGSDGSVGITRIKEKGGVTIAQAPNDAEYDGMPSSAISTGTIDFVLPLSDMSQKLLDLRRNISQIELPDADALNLPGKTVAAEDQLRSEEALGAIMDILRTRTGHDFSHYKRATVLRRIERRMQVSCVSNLNAYLEYFETHVEEAPKLLQDMLISVTNFFRDRECFDALERDIIPRIFAEADPDSQIRAWSTGCATGEEAYSIAMLMAEHKAMQKPVGDIQVFATDIDERAIAFGRKGLYPESIVTDIAPGRLRNFFTKHDNHFQVKKEVREKVLFAAHNILRDPPFSRVHLITCRNLLIYLNRDVQQRIFEMFHFALLPGGFLFLGSSESAELASQFFVPVDKKNRIYRALISPQAPRYAPTVAYRGISPSMRPQALQVDAKPLVGYAEVHRRLLEQYAPPSVLVNREGEIVFLSERAGLYLRHAGGEPSRNLVSLIIPELRIELRTALFQATQHGAGIETRAVPLSREGKNLHIGLNIRPVEHQETTRELYLVLFNEVELDPIVAVIRDTGPSNIVAQLEGELLVTKEQLQRTIEQYETSSEELKASNEELQAINEELRSTTEELETSKEELQSINEELITVNHELKMKVDETGKSNDDLHNFIAATEIATIFVDRSLRIKRYTPRAAAIFNLIGSDIGRPLLDITHRLHYDLLEEDASNVFESLRVIEREVESDADEWYIARLIPYRTTEDRIDGLVLTFIDITSLHKTRKRLYEEEQRMRLIAASTKDYAILTFDQQGLITSWNCGAQRLFGYEEEEIIGQLIDKLFTPEDRANGVPQAEMETARMHGKAEDDRWHMRKDGSRLFCGGVTTKLEDEIHGFAKIARDLTGVKEEESRRERLFEQECESRRKMEVAAKMRNEFLAVLSHELKQPLNLIHLNAEMLKRIPETSELPKVRRAAETIRGAAISQATLIDDLLDLSRAQTGKLSLDKKLIDVAVVLDRIVHALDGDAASKNLSLQQTLKVLSVNMYADVTRIEQIIWNLLSNAIKFTDPGGRVEVSLDKNDSECILTVSDSGKGIEPHYLPFIFEMFNQAERGTTRVHGGLGIGLALVRELVESHGGSISATSAGLGKGAEFIVKLPLTETLNTDLSSEIDRADQLDSVLTGKRILIVEDDKQSLEAFGELLASLNVDFTSAVRGDIALQKISAERFDLVISDIAMPGMDGYQLLEQIKNIHPAMPVIAVTGFGRLEDVSKALNAGFSAHLRKPVVLNELLRTAKHLFQNNHDGSDFPKSDS
jgi:two-component system CheB/CheR fusion protein